MRIQCTWATTNLRFLINRVTCSTSPSAVSSSKASQGHAASKLVHPSAKTKTQASIKAQLASRSLQEEPGMPKCSKAETSQITILPKQSPHGNQVSSTSFPQVDYAAIFKAITPGANKLQGLNPYRPVSGQKVNSLLCSDVLWPTLHLIFCRWYYQAACMAC